MKAKEMIKSVFKVEIYGEPAFVQHAMECLARFTQDLQASIIEYQLYSSCVEETELNKILERKPT